MTSNGTQLARTPPPSPATPDAVNFSATTSSQTVVIRGKRYRQRPLGPAPFASFEDLSDELDSPPETARIPLPGIKEDSSSQAQSPTSPSLHQMTGVSLTEREEQGLKDALTSSLDAPAPPRIDISRASSSSQHEDSITSSPERENGTHNLGYKEDGTVDLRSSTEELDYIQEPGTVEESEERRKRERMMKRQQQVRDFGDTQSQHEFVERKDSSCSVMSDTGLLCISGRTSRLSSIGSAASGGSAASAASNLSVGSTRSSRSPSPHKMLLETSFCGNKPAQCRSAEPEASPSLVTPVERSASRPPSRVSSRSPSPHKMLLETSFCGAKPLPSAEAKAITETPTKTPKKAKPKPSSVTVVEAEIVSQTAQKQETPPKVVEVKVKPERGPTRTEKVSKVEEPKPSTSGISSTSSKDRQRRNENAIESLGVARKIKPVAQHVKIPSKPKKVISIRDLPGDEIYIPLKGPEIDFEEIIRQGSPNVQKKEPVKSTSVKEKADEIYIPLHSPPKSKSKPKEEESRPGTSRDSDENSIYIPLHSPPKTSRTTPAKKSVAQKSSESVSKKTSDDKKGKGKEVYKKTKYEVCEDGSIIIPLHSPEEERTARKFEEEIRRVDMELQKAREMSERKAREEESKSKQGTTDLSDSGSHKSRLSQTFSVGKPEGTSGGSRTPSPGSSLSRKSSFASLFRKSEAHGSPDSSQGGSTSRRKSGTLTTMLKEAGDGLRERSRSRSKSRERQGDSSVTPSPLSKKNVFTNLFTKKKAEAKKVSGKENAKLSPQFDLRFTFNSEAESKKASDEGDYIIIPLRDPSDPPVSLDTEEPPITVETEVVERPPSPLVILERTESPKMSARSKEVQSEVVQEGAVTKAKKSSSKESISGIKKRSESEERIGKRGRRSSSESKKSEKRSSDASLEGNLVKETSKIEEPPSVSSPQNGVKETTEPSTSFDKTSALLQEQEEKDDRLNFQIESSLDMDERGTPEGLVGVLDDGVRVLRLPPESGDLEEDHERKGLVYQDSFEDELPYVPTTLPLERSVGVKIVPVKHRVAEIKTCPIERPRSTTPINPTSLEDFVASKEVVTVSEEEKMKISLPREDSTTSKSKSPRRFSAKGKTWFEFAEAGLQSPRDCRKGSLRTTPSPPPLPPRSSPPSVLSTSAPPTTSSWVDLESLPEKKKHPKKITTIPILRDTGDGNDGGSTDRSIPSGSLVYSYVSPENCQCECHDHKPSHSKESESKRGTRTQLEVDAELDNEQLEESYVDGQIKSETRGDDDKSDCEDGELGKYVNAERDIENRPLLDGNSDGENDDSSKGDWDLTKPEIRLDVDKSSQLSDSSYECQENGSGLESFATDFAHMKPFGMDLGVDSNRSSLISQDDQSSPE